MATVTITLTDNPTATAPCGVKVTENSRPGFEMGGGAPPTPAQRLALRMIVGHDDKIQDPDADGETD